MTDGPLHLTALAWLFTYGVHSTVLLGLAWLACRCRWVRSVRAREILWRTALVGGLVTAGVQFGLGVEPLAGRYALEPARAQAPPPDAVDVEALALLPSMPDQPAARTGTAEPRSAEIAGALDWTRWALLGWAAGGLLLLTLLLDAARRLRAHLAGRRPLTEGELPRMLAELRAAAGLRRRVRLSVSPRIQAPIAMGSLFPHIVVPPRAVDDLAPELQAPMLAHELGHVARFDPLWLDLCRLIETILFFQPLNRVAHRHLAECAEFQCDAWAIERTGDRVSLARCLTEVAGWLVAERRALPACGMAELRSPLAERVTRILRTEPERAARRAPLAGAAVALLALTAAGAPGFAAAPRANTPPEPTTTVGDFGPDALALDLLGVLEELEVELDSLRDELRDLGREAERRDVDDDVHATLALYQARTDALDERQRHVRELVRLYLRSLSVPDLSVPDPNESR